MTVIRVGSVSTAGASMAVKRTRVALRGRSVRVSSASLPVALREAA
jgi:hypothetical protein